MVFARLRATPRIPKFSEGAVDDGGNVLEKIGDFWSEVEIVPRGTMLVHNWFECFVGQLFYVEQSCGLVCERSGRILSGRTDIGSEATATEEADSLRG
jgi:hypothetical protein